MRTFKLRTPRPELDDDVTRLWLSPGLDRIGVVFGQGIQNNYACLCWDTAAGRALWEADLHDMNETFPDPDFDRELKHVVFTSYPEGGEEEQEATLGLREIASGSEVRLGGTGIYAHLPVMTPAGTYVLAVAEDGINRRRELRRWAIRPPGAGERVPETESEVAPDRKWTIRLPNLGRGVVQQLANLVTALTVSPDGERVAAGRRNGSVAAWNVASRRQVMTASPLKGTKYTPFSTHRLVFSSDGTRLAGLRGKRLNPRYSLAVSVWALPSGGQLKGPQEKVSVNGVAFSPDGRTLLTAREDGRIGMWDTATWKLRHEYAWKIGKLFCVAFAPDGLTCAAGGEKGKVVVWDVDA
jgi:hypothetical protein